MNRSADLSVIMPTYKRPEYLAEALRQILKVRAVPLEVLVVDDSPDAEGQAVVAALADDRIRYSTRAVPSNGRPALLRNEAAREAAGKILYFLDDDDLVVPEALPAAFALLNDSTEGVLITLPMPFGEDASKVSSEVTYYENARKVLARRPSHYEVDARLTFTASFIVPSACLMKRSVFETVGGFDEDVPLCEDVDLFAKAIASAGYVPGDLMLVNRRVGHTSLMSEAKAEALRQSYIVLHAGFRKRHGTFAYWFNRLRYKLSEL